MSEHKTLEEAFANTAKALQIFGIERIRIRELCGKDECDGASDENTPDVRTINEEEFMREFVFLSRPCVIVGAIDNWPALQKWRNDEYLFDLDHHLSYNDTKCSSLINNGDDHVKSDDDRVKGDDTTDRKSEREGNTQEEEEEEEERTGDANSSSVKKVTVTLTPNGRADAVTYVLYDDRDITDKAEREEICHGSSEAKPVLMTPSAFHSVIATDESKSHVIEERSTSEQNEESIRKNENSTNCTNQSEEPTEVLSELSTMNVACTSEHLHCEKIFMYAAEAKVTLQQLYKLLQSSPMHPPSHAQYIDMRTYKIKPSITSHNKTDNVNSSKGSVKSTCTHDTPVVAYAQLQNNCLNTEYKFLQSDIERNVEEFGIRVFGGKPEAANVWFGIPASVSSMHQDWVENLYSVVRGVKEFVLIPPWEGVFVPKPELPAAAFALDNNNDDICTTCTNDNLLNNAQTNKMECDNSKADVLATPHFQFAPYPHKDGTAVPWMELEFSGEMLEADNGESVVNQILHEAIADNEARKPHLALRTEPHNSHARSCANTKNELNTKKETSIIADHEANVVNKDNAINDKRRIHPLVAYVHAGETLYLPAMWLHRVAQHADTHDLHRRAHFHSHSKVSKNKNNNNNNNVCQSDNLEEVTNEQNDQNKENSIAKNVEEMTLNVPTISSTTTKTPTSQALPPLPLIAAVNYWYDMSFVNPSVVMLREFGLLL